MCARSCRWAREGRGHLRTPYRCPLLERTALERGPCVCVCVCVCVRACSVTQWCPTLWDPMEAHQTPLSMGFPKKEYWSGLPFPSPGGSPGDLPDPGIEPTSPTSAGRFFTSEPPGKSPSWGSRAEINQSIHPSLHHSVLQTCTKQFTHQALCSYWGEQAHSSWPPGASQPECDDQGGSMKTCLYFNDASETNSLNSNPSSFIYQVIMGKFCDFSVPQCPHLWKRWHLL